MAGNTSSCFCWGEKGYIQAPPKKMCCCGFQVLSDISLQPRLKHFGSLRRTVVAPHQGHQHILWLTQAALCPAKLHRGPCFKVPRALSALCLFLGQTHLLFCYGEGGKVVWAYLTLQCLHPISLPVVTASKNEIAFEILFLPVRAAAEFGWSLES